MAAKFADNELLPIAAQVDHEGKIPQDIYQKLSENGFWGVFVPEEYGGAGMDYVAYAIIVEELSRGCASTGVLISAHASLATWPILQYGNEEQKKKYLPGLASGETVGCFCLSEPNAGSDLANLSTMAIREGDHYIMNGQKTWTTGAHHADMMFCLARTDPNSKRSRGLSVFNINLRTPGIEIRPILYMNGAHITNEVFLTDVKVPVEERVGPENEGWKLTRATMNFERSNAGAYAGMKRILEELLEYVKTHERDGKLLAEHPSVRRKMADLFMDIEVGRALAYKIAWLQEGGNLLFSPAAASESKVFSSELRQRVSQVGTEIMGLYGQLSRSKWAPLYGSMVDGYQVTIGSTICAGSNEIQRNLIAWVGLELPRFK